MSRLTTFATRAQAEKTLQWGGGTMDAPEPE